MPNENSSCTDPIAKKLKIRYTMRILANNPSCTSTPLPTFQGFKTVHITNAKAVLDRLNGSEPVDGVRLLDIWSNHHPSPAVAAQIAKPLLEGLLTAHENDSEVADITAMLAQNIHFVDPKSGEERILTPLGIWEFIGPWLSIVDDKTKILKLKLEYLATTLSPKVFDPAVYTNHFPIDPHIPPVYWKR